jgi:hypothetical protein
VRKASSESEVKLKSFQSLQRGLHRVSSVSSVWRVLFVVLDNWRKISES